MTLPSPTQSQRDVFEDAYSIDRKTLLETVGTRFRQSLLVADAAASEDVISLLRGAFEIAWAQEAEFAVLPEALSDAVLPAALVTLDSHRDELRWRDIESVPEHHFQTQIASTFYDALVRLYWEHQELGLETEAELAFADG
jgi:hypothetical protein